MSAPHESPKTVPQNTADLAGCIGGDFWRFRALAAKRDFEPRLSVWDRVEYYRQIPCVAVALQIRGGIKLACVSGGLAPVMAYRCGLASIG